MDQDLLSGSRLGRLGGLVLASFDELAIDKGRPGADERDQGTVRMVLGDLARWLQDEEATTSVAAARWYGLRRSVADTHGQSNSF